MEKNKYNYYTPEELVIEILKLIPDIKINSIIDLCCGTWNMLKAGKQMYPDAEIIGVDTDFNMKKYKIKNAKFYVSDGRMFAINQKKIANNYDLILSNPPYGYIHQDNSYRKEIFSFKESIQSLINNRYECEMMSANFLLAHDNSVIIMVLPFTIIAGSTCKKLRCEIAEKYSILSLIKLPLETFEIGKINTFAIVLQKNKNNKSTTLYNAEYKKKWEIEKKKTVDLYEILRGNWWFEDEIVEDLGVVKICRGNISTNMFSEGGNKVFHCSNKKEKIWKPSVRFSNNCSKYTKKARKGDILINRIGKDAGYWIVNKIDNVCISDCLLCVSFTNDNIYKIFDELSDKNGRLDIPLRGLTTLYVTSEDIKKILNREIKRKYGV